MPRGRSISMKSLATTFFMISTDLIFPASCMAARLFRVFPVRVVFSASVGDIMPKPLPIAICLFKDLISKLSYSYRRIDDILELLSIARLVFF